jgi:hypothetical protein
LADIDHRVGGGYACGTVLQFLTTVVDPMLRGAYSDNVGRDLFAAAARLYDLAAFMCFDSNRNGLAQQLFGIALQMADMSDPKLGAHIRADMAIQAHHLGRTTDALAISEAGVDAARRTSSASTLARCLSIRARAMALAHDAVNSDRTLNEAELALERSHFNDEPQWIRFFNPHQLATESMYVAADLRRPRHVRRHAAGAFAPRSAMQRRHVLATATLAYSYLAGPRPASHDIEHACHLLGSVASDLPSLTSTRALHAVNTTRRRLARSATNPAVTGLEDKLRAAFGQAE